MSLQEKIRDLVIDQEASLLSAIKKMDELVKKLLLVTKNGQYLSILTIGDIQRHLIKHQNFDAPIKEVLRAKEKVRVVREGDSINDVKSQMLLHRMELVPVLNDFDELVDVHLWEDMFGAKFEVPEGNLRLPVVIMAGGKGTRLQPITNIIPKPLIPLGEKPVMEMIIDRFVGMGARDFYISVNYKADMIALHFNSIPDKKYAMNYFTEDKPLGTAGSLHLLKDKIKSTFFVSNCDIIIEQDYQEIYNYHKQNENELTLVAAIKQYRIPYGTLEVASDGLLVSLQEKPEFNFMVNAGMYIIEPHLLEEIPENEFYHITHLIEKITKRGGRVGVFPVSEKSWSDIGEWPEYRQTLERYGYKSW